jgi:hypothetical protein
LPEQAEEQRRGVDRAVVARERGLAEGRGLADAQLVEHLAGLLVALVVVLLSESPRQQPQGLLGDAAHERQHLERRDQAVATEERGEPRHPGRVVRLPIQLGVEQVEVIERPVEDSVEQLIVGGHAGAALVGAARAATGDLAVAALGHLEVDDEVDRAVRLELQVEHERPSVRPAWRRCRVDRGGAPDPVTPHEGEPLGPGVRRRPLVPRHDSAQLEHRQEVGAEAQLQRDADRLPVVAAHRDPLAQRARGLRRPLNAQA